MENFTKEFYLENRQKKRYNKQAFFFGPGATYKFNEIIPKLKELEKEFEDKEEVDLWIDASGYDEFGECYLVVSWKDWETEEEFELRMREKKMGKGKSRRNIEIFY